MENNLKDLLANRSLEQIQPQTPRQSEAAAQLKKPKGENGLYYVIDPITFIEAPYILSRISSDHIVVLPITVIDELDKKKNELQGENSHNCRKAIESINKAIEEKDERLQMIGANFKLLPDDFNRRNPDNVILAVALQCPKESTVVLTSDVCLQVKSRAVGLQTIGLQAFLSSLKNQNRD